MHRIGLFGGTFNPIHYGHLRTAEEVREALALHRIWFIPAADPPHKEGSHIIPVSHRLEMARLAVRRHPEFAVCDFEAMRAETSYSLYTIRHYRRILGEFASIYFVIGTDAFAEITTWHKWRDVLTSCHFAVMARPGSSLERPGDALPADWAARYTTTDDAGVFRHESGMEIVFVPVTELDISSSDIRDRRARAGSIAFLTPPAVIHYIRDHDLYQS